jgi:hypothetical protein
MTIRKSYHYLPEKQQYGRGRADRDTQLPNNICLVFHKPDKADCSAWTGDFVSTGQGDLWVEEVVEGGIPEVEGNQRSGVPTWLP